MKRVLAAGMLFVAAACFADIKKDAAKFVPEGWIADIDGAVIADFNSDGAEDIALVYYAIDPDMGEFDNRMNRVLVLIADGKGYYESVNQRLPMDSDYGTEVTLDYFDGVLKIFQHRGIMHLFNEWGITWDEFTQRFWERTSGWGGLVGLGSSGYYDALTGLGSAEKIWDDVDVSVEYATIYAEKLEGTITLDGKPDEPDWQRPFATTNFWVTWGNQNWGEEEDASIQVRALFDEVNLYLLAEVRDDEQVLPKGEDDILASDHLELWIDRLTSDVLTEESIYVYDWQRKKDAYTVQIALAESVNGKALIRMWLPEENSVNPGIDAGFSRTAGTWTAEISIPWEIIHPSGPVDYFSFSLVFSDSDNGSNPRQETLIGTSTVSWAEPFTFGQLLTSKPYRTYWGIYPEEEK
ncbi:hypothetical protein JXM67_08720 [candidate division WOR-3 bacterium]|nr:hypothetical protein [candidate division WOR-3 bacterium]